MKLVTVGECTRDHYLDLDVERVGGISLNFAIHARRSGASHVAIVSCTGSDLAAHRVQDALVRESVDVSHLHSAKGSTASQVIRLEAAGERTFPAGGYDPGVLADFRLDAGDLAFIETFDIVVAPYFRQIEHLYHAAVRAASPNAKRVVDLLAGDDLGPDLAGIDAMLDTMDLAFISADEGVVGQLLPRSLHTRTLIVVTHGANGSSALTGGRRHFQPAIPVPIAACVDSTGCGDAYQAAFTVEYFRSGRARDAMRAGAERASQVIRHLGATGH